jgi:NTE family protein
MTLSTLINAGLTRPSHPRVALVLMGGGARTAYQAGVLQALADMLRLQNPSPALAQSAAQAALGRAESSAATSPSTYYAAQGLASASNPSPNAFPFQILLGTSAGALNASFLAARAT